MSLLPHDASFHEQVQDCFAAYRGRGLMLSALDVELVDAWSATGVPFEVVARGIRQAAEAALWDAPEDGGGLRSLAACRRKVEAEIKKYLARAPAARPDGGAPLDAPDEPPLHLARHKKLRGALRKVAKEHPALAGPALGLADRLPPPADYAAASRQEALAMMALLRGLSREPRRALLREARSLVQKAGALTAGARRESLRFHRAALLRRNLELPSFW